MLVLSRKQSQSVVFPNLGISVEIVRIAGKTVQVGVEAPPNIKILRGELQDRYETTTSSTELSNQQRHEQRNRLNRVTLSLSLLQKQLRAGQLAEAEESLSIALEALSQLDMSSPAQPEQSLRTAFAHTVPPAVPQRKRALLVEDDPNERALLASYLRASGYEVDTAEDGQAALEYLAQHKPDAVVMDMEMPRLHGSEALREIRSDDSFDDMKLYVVSGADPTQSAGQSEERGIQRWFQKPLSPEDLVNELRNSLT